MDNIDLKNEQNVSMKKDTIDLEQNGSIEKNNINFETIKVEKSFRKKYFDFQSPKWRKVKDCFTFFTSLWMVCDIVLDIISVVGFYQEMVKRLVTLFLMN